MKREPIRMTVQDYTNPGVDHYVIELPRGALDNLRVGDPVPFGTVVEVHRRVIER